jgi:hypothetical protein
VQRRTKRWMIDDGDDGQNRWNASPFIIRYRLGRCREAHKLLLQTEGDSLPLKAGNRSSRIRAVLNLTELRCPCDLGRAGYENYRTTWIPARPECVIWIIYKLLKRTRKNGARSSKAVMTRVSVVYKFKLSLNHCECWTELWSWKNRSLSELYRLWLEQNTL